MAETGWTKEWPITTGHYWRRISTDIEPLLARVQGDTYHLVDGTFGFRSNRFEWLGPISPTDFEQLTRLREAAQKLVEAAQFSLTTPGMIRGRDQLANSMEALREALAQRNTGGK